MSKRKIKQLHDVNDVWFLKYLKGIHLLDNEWFERFWFGNSIFGRLKEKELSEVFTTNSINGFGYLVNSALNWTTSSDKWRKELSYIKRWLFNFNANSAKRNKEYSKCLPVVDNNFDINTKKFLDELLTIALVVKQLEDTAKVEYLWMRLSALYNDIIYTLIRFEVGVRLNEFSKEEYTTFIKLLNNKLMDIKREIYSRGFRNIIEQLNGGYNESQKSMETR